MSGNSDQTITRGLKSASAVDIPASNRTGDSEDVFQVPSIVGSPEQVDDLSAIPSASFYSAIGSPRSARSVAWRPSIGDRSVTSPVTRRRANTTTSNRPLSNTSRRTPGSTPREQEWSLFSQLMQNEGQIRTPSSAHKHPGNRVSSGRATAVATVAEDPFLAPAPVQSPAEEENGFHSFASQPPSDESSDEEDSHSEVHSDASSQSSYTSAATTHVKSRWPAIPAIPLLYRNILKCAIAYFIASLFTYSPYLSQFIRDLVPYGLGGNKPLPSGHMVATVAVYFNPAKTVGAMVEADVFCILGVFYAAFVSLSAMGMYWALELKPGLEWLGDTLVIVWIGLCMSALAWMKVWMANPQFGTACSMMAITIFVVIVKEGGLHTLLQVAFIVACGTAVSNLVCFIIWPQAATVNLQLNMTKTLNSFSTLLSLLTNTFLLHEGLHSPSSQRIQKAVENHQNSFTGLRKDLKEAKKEWLFQPRTQKPKGFVNGILGKENKEKGRLGAYEDAVDALNRLAQHLNGLRSGTRLQYDLTRSGAFGSRKRKGMSKFVGEDDESVMLKAAASMFGDLVEDLGPPLEALSDTCTKSLRRLRDAFDPTRVKSGKMEAHEFGELSEGIEAALLRFESTSNHALVRLYRKAKIDPSIITSHSMEDSILGDNSILTSSDNEHVFLVYFFIFTLQEFSRELVSLVDAMRRIYMIEQSRPTWFGWIRKLGTLLVRKPGSRRETIYKRPTQGLQKRISKYLEGGRRTQIRPQFPKVRPHAPNTIQTPYDELSLFGRLKQRLWSIGKRLGERDAKYAIKAGMAIAILAAPAFFDVTRPIFVEYWGDWALISFFVVISPTVGATNFLAVHRIVGTIFGATVAAGIFTLFSNDPAILAIFGFFFSIPCFYYIVGKPRYNSREQQLSVVYVASHRAISVTVGVVWAAIVSRFWWPAEARRELSKSLSEFCLNLGWLYTRLVYSNSFSPDPNGEESESTTPSETSALLPATKRRNPIHEFMAMELHLQIKLIELQGLLAQTAHEPRLKGPFPIQLYRGILTSLQTILDRLHSMRCVTTREEWYTSVRKDFIVPVNKERRSMVGNIILYFSILSSAFRLKSPLPPYLPPAEKSREELVDAIRKLDVVRNRDIKGSRQLLFFAYSLTMKGVTEELEKLGKTLQNAFGVIGQSTEEFEALFRAEAETIV